MILSRQLEIVMTQRMQWFAGSGLVVLALFAVIGCQRAAPPVAATPAKDPSVADNLAKLTAEDRALAEAQGYCAVQPEQLLGSMGVPIKVIVKDQPVFVCCKGCEKKAVSEADATLAQVAELKAKTAAEKPATP
jgi:hypothetical protein